MANFTNFNLPVNAYTGFDAQTLRDLIIERINNDNTINFTDQNFEGSNISALIDIIAYSYHTLLFYLNQTASESNFNDAELYENVNRLVKLIDYKPVGKQASVLPVNIKATSDQSAGYYTVPRFTFATSQGKTFTFPTDLTYEKLTTTTETISAVGNQLMYEGTIEEYPLVSPLGESFETVNLLPGANTVVDHFNIYVYVKEVNENNTWYEWKRTPSLFLSNANDRNYEVKYNENKKYEIKFGNNVNGKKLNLGDQVAIYYLKSSGVNGKVTKNHFVDTSINVYNTTQYDEIFADVKDTSLNYLAIGDAVDVSINNTEDSTDFGEEETVEDIKQNAPKFFSSEYKLTTKPDYKAFIQSNFKNLIYDVTVANNSDYVNKYLHYLNNELGLTDFVGDTNALFNQYYFADSADVNNIYLTIVPNLRKNKSVVTRSNYLSPALKEKIINDVRPYKMLNSEIMFTDPVYLNLDFGLRLTREPIITDHMNYTRLVLERDSKSLVNSENLKSKVFNIINNYISEIKLGQSIDIRFLNNEIRKIEGLAGFYMQRIDSNIKVDGLSFGIFNPVYNGKDLQYIDTLHELEYFQIPYIESAASMQSKIVVLNTTKGKTVSEY